MHTGQLEAPLPGQTDEHVDDVFGGRKRDAGGGRAMTATFSRFRLSGAGGTSRHPELRLRIGKVHPRLREATWHHADDRASSPVEHDRSADECLQSALKYRRHAASAQDDDRISTRSLFTRLGRRGQAAAGCRASGNTAEEPPASRQVAPHRPRPST